MTSSLFLACGLAFLVGSIPTAFLAGKYLGRIDIRKHGSGNVGATNAVRVMGKRIGLAVFALDWLKGLLPTVFFAPIFLNDPSPEARVWVGFCAILGHIFTPFLGFRGGKGIATGGGVICGGYPVIFAIAIGAWAVCFFTSRIVSISSLVALVALILCAIIFPIPIWGKLYFLTIVLLGAWTHRSNISRIKRGDENKVGK
ncbi:MAG TPA: glycerol-3-phosphate 1-O-acyltransferase PlsY [Candidatus Omnitrophota bacterium]|nr:glycerol-3-phosphate 1-O-acyltransferase PlsY [Candidatus Omnitrophota bacterium]